MKLTKTQYENLKQFEDKLNSAVRSNYVRMSPQEFAVIVSIYESIYKEKVSPAKKNCSHCRLTLIKKLAADYENYKPQGRPPKIDLNAE